MIVPTSRTRGLARTGVLLLAGAVLSGWLGGCNKQPTGAPSGAAPAAAEAPDAVVARVAGEEVTRAELMKKAAEPLEEVDLQLLACQADADTKRFDALRSALKEIVDDRVLAAEASARGVSRDELLASELGGKVRPVSPGDVDAFYEQNRARIQAPKEQVAPRIAQYLAAQYQAEAYGRLLAQLGEKHGATTLLEPPRHEIGVNGPAKGPATASVTIVEFSDFQCPYCSRVVPTLARITADYGDKVRLVYRQFPLSIHPDAQKAAEASLCADEQGKFWEMHDRMFGDQQGLAVAGLKEKAAALGLDAASFDACLDSAKFAEAVKSDVRDGVRAGVTGTPALFVNGIPLSGAVPYEEIAKLIDQELGKGAGA